jgi:hypothetical protein
VVSRSRISGIPREGIWFYFPSSAGRKPWEDRQSHHPESTSHEQLLEASSLSCEIVLLFRNSVRDERVWGRERLRILASLLVGCGEASSCLMYVSDRSKDPAPLILKQIHKRNILKIPKNTCTFIPGVRLGRYCPTIIVHFRPYTPTACFSVILFSVDVSNLFTPWRIEGHFYLKK